VEMCKDYKGVELAQGTLEIDLDPIANIPAPAAAHKPMSRGGLNPLAFRLASATVGLYTYDNSGRNPQCKVTNNDNALSGYTFDAFPAACTSKYVDLIAVSNTAARLPLTPILRTCDLALGTARARPTTCSRTSARSSRPPRPPGRSAAAWPRRRTSLRSPLAAGRTSRASCSLVSPPSSRPRCRPSSRSRPFSLCLR
jgi:hypothetical protein